MATGTEIFAKTTIDSWVNQTNANANYGGAGYLYLNGDAAANKKAFIHFARPFQLGATVFNATLRLHIAGSWTGSNTITVTRVTEVWGERMITWTNQPTVTSTNQATASVTGGADGDLVEVDLTAMMNDIAAGSDWFGLRVAVNTTSNRLLYSAENPNQTLRAALDIDWGVYPHAPVRLNPTGNQAVASSKPVLDWQFASPDHTATRRQSYSQVLVNSTADMTSPDYNSGWVANTQSQWDLSAATSPSFTALSDGDTFFWRVRVKDDQGLASDWTATARSVYHSLGTLAMSNPPASPSNTVDDLTPEIDWSLTSRTQEAFELRLYQYDGTDLTLKWRLPKVTSTATAYNIPKGYIKTGELYRIVLLVWDTIDRTVTPGSNDYVTLGRDFSYARNGTPAPCVNLTATVATGGAKVTLAWERSVMPDWFTIKANGVEVFDRVDPDSVHVSGSDYQMDFWRAVPRVATTYEVEAVETAAGPGPSHNSSGNDTDTATTNPIGIHLADEDDGTRVIVWGTDTPDMTIRKVGTTYDLMGSREPVRIEDAIEGYGGTVSGSIKDFAGFAASVYRDHFLTLMGRSPKKLRLIIGDSNLEVVVEDGGVAPTAIPGDALYDVSFSFVQTDASNTFSVTGGA